MDAARFRSRTESPPARSTGGPACSQDFTSSSTVDRAASACPAAFASTACGRCSRWTVTVGATGAVSRCARPPRRWSATSRGRTTVRADAGSSSPRSRSQRTGGAGLGVTSPYGGPHTSRPSTWWASAGASSSSADIRSGSVNRAVSEVTADTGSWVAGSPTAATISCTRVGDIPDVASATVGPRPVGEGRWADGASSSRAVRTRRSRSSSPHTRAWSRRVPRAPGSAARAPLSSPVVPSSPVSSDSSTGYGHGSGATASASAVCSVNRSRRSSARTTEARVPARVASWVTSPGTGLSRSGRAWSRADRPASSRARSASARERGAPLPVPPPVPVPVPPAAVLASGTVASWSRRPVSRPVPIRSTVSAAPAAAPRAHALPSGQAVREEPGRGDRKRPSGLRISEPRRGLGAAAAAFLRGPDAAGVGAAGRDRPSARQVRPGHSGRRTPHPGADRHAGGGPGHPRHPVGRGPGVRRTLHAVRRRRPLGARPAGTRAPAPPERGCAEARGGV